MIVLDTNVVSEMMKPSPSQAVLDWLNRQESERLHLTTVTIDEIEYGLRILPDGQRRRDLKDRFNRFVATAFAMRVLSYDEPAALCYREIMAARKALGRPTSMPAGQIAAIRPGKQRCRGDAQYTGFPGMRCRVDRSFRRRVLSDRFRIEGRRLDLSKRSFRES